MIQPEELVGGEWAEWYRLTPVQRWLESEKLWQTYLALGGALDPEPDTQSPFFGSSRHSGEDPESHGPGSSRRDATRIAMGATRGLGARVAFRP